MLLALTELLCSFLQSFVLVTLLASVSIVIAPTCYFISFFLCMTSFVFEKQQHCLLIQVIVAGQFSCEIEHNGKVHVRGVTTTGENFVSRHTRVFEMKVQQQCPPGPFTLSFSLPGPVDPRMFFPNFRSDGILEAVALKYE